MSTADGGTSRRARAVACTTLFLLATLPVLGQLTSSFDNADEVIMVIYPQWVLDGSIPHLDFATVYAAPQYWALAGIYEVFGATPTVERLIGLGYHVALVFGVLAMTRRFGFWQACAAAGTCALVLPMLGIFAIPYLAALALLAFGIALAQHETSRVHWFAAGLLGGLASGVRYEFAVIALAAGLPWLLGKRWRWMTLGAVVGAVPTILTLLFAFDEVYANVYEERIGINSQVNLDLVGSSVFVGLGICVLGSLGLLAAALRLRDRWFWSCSLAGLLILPQAFQRIDEPHMAVVGSFVFPAVVAPLLAAPIVREAAGKAPRLVAGVTAGLVALVLAAQGIASAATLADAPPEVRHDGKSVRLGGELPAEVDATIADVEELVPAGSRLFLGTQDMSFSSNPLFPLYYLLSPEYEFDQYYVEVGSAIAGKRWASLERDIEEADALVLFDVPFETAKRLTPNIARGDQSANDAVRAGFCKRTEHGRLALYLPCTPAG